MPTTPIPAPRYPIGYSFNGHSSSSSTSDSVIANSSNPMGPPPS
eukprot:CAMPEP_0184665196 /NCGR_PEP_ID=MMETSP0308-20130426/56166_1 /TAXON_ID=38269 /ORGANISM="Gloeochaete witrockiana, Strain SAG 46.84" /LENGTH=43 /DNA_ID= /DNA_START= /DNA_END= /DNA_ORIENTATION=